jgi:hypothetical protein
LVDKLPIFKEKTSAACWKMFLEFASLPYKMEVGISKLFSETWNVELQGKTDS